MDLIYRYPFLALAPGLVLGIFFVIKRSDLGKNAFKFPSLWLVFISGLLWFLYGILECFISYFENTGVGAPIRIDLFLAIPLFYIVLPLGIIGVLRLIGLPRQEG